MLWIKIITFPSRNFTCSIPRISEWKITEISKYGSGRSINLTNVHGDVFMRSWLHSISILCDAILALYTEEAVSPIKIIIWFIRNAEKKEISNISENSYIVLFISATCQAF